MFRRPGSYSALFGPRLNQKTFDVLLLGRRGRVLEVGPGKKRLSPNSVTVGNQPDCDVDVLADARRLPFVDGEFDLAVAHEVLCTHSREEQKDILLELERVANAVYIRQWKNCAWRGCGLKVGYRDAYRRP